MMMHSFYIQSYSANVFIDSLKVYLARKAELEKIWPTKKEKNIYRNVIMVLKKNQCERENKKV